MFDNTNDLIYNNNSSNNVILIHEKLDGAYYYVFLEILPALKRDHDTSILREERQVI